MMRLVLVLLGVGIAVTALNWGQFGDRGIAVFLVPWASVAGGYAVLMLLAWLFGQPVTGSVFRSTRAIRWMTLGYFFAVYYVNASVWRAYRHGAALPSATVAFASRTFLVGLDVFIALLLFWAAISIGKRSRTSEAS
jgi:hypothetical protein